MRPDMAKVIVERPRGGMRVKTPKGYRRRWQRYAAGEEPRREGIRRPWSGNSKHLSEHLAPLLRYLHKQVGRPWDKVFAEICQHIRQDSAVQSHVRDHVGDFVAIHVIEVDGVLCYGDGYHVGTPLGRWGWTELYVCPRTGLLRRIKNTARQKRKTPPRDYIQVDDTRRCQKIDGLWFEITFRPLVEVSATARDVLLQQAAREITEWMAERHYGAKVYAASKRQLSKREIRRLTLKKPNR